MDPWSAGPAGAIGIDRPDLTGLAFDPGPENDLVAWAPIRRVGGIGRIDDLSSAVPIEPASGRQPLLVRS